MNPGAMGLLSLFRKKSVPPKAALSEGSGAATPPPAAAVVWRKRDFITFSAGEELQVVYARHGTPATLPAFTLEFAMSCFEFKPLDAHLAQYAGKHGWHSLQVEALRQWLPRMIDAGVLVSSEQVRAQCAAMPADAVPPTPIGTIGFPTGGNRVPLLVRAVESFAANLRAHGRKAEFIVADSSTRPEQRAAFRAAAAELSRGLEMEVLYSGEEERRRFAEALIARAGCRPEAVEFALFDPLGTGFACGANRNALLLHGAGRMLCSVDDDVICRLALPPELRSARVSLFSNCDPFSRWLFADRESALETARFVERDFLAAHEELLGRSVGGLCPADLPAAEFSLADAGDDLLRRLELGAARVRTTFLGHVGDPGIPSSCYYLYYDGDNRRRLTQNEAHYRAALASRSVLSAVPALSIGDSSVSPGMAMGLDHRELLPPFFPVLHAEDFIFGATVWQCCPGAVAGHQSLCVLHEPGPGKSILLPSDLGPARRVVLFEFAHLLRRVILDFEPAQRASAVDRTQALGRALSELAAMPLVDFVEVLRAKTLEHESEKLGYLEDRLKDEQDAPDFWRRDVENFLLQAREALTADDFDIPYDLKTGRTPAENRVFMQQLFARYGQLLQEWPAMVEAACDLRTAGLSLAILTP
jgi:hypothetical protein